MKSNLSNDTVPNVIWLNAVITKNVNAGANWQDVDLSGDGIPANVEILWSAQTGGSAGMRPKGSALDFRGTTGAVGNGWGTWCPVDASSIIQAYWDAAQAVDYHIWAYRINTTFRVL